MCAIDLFSTCSWAVPFKNKRGITIAHPFQKMLPNSKSSEAKSKGRKPNKIWVDKSGEFYNNLSKRFLKINDIEIYSTHNERKSVFAERFIRNLKNKIFKHMTAISKNVYFDVLDDIAKNTITQFIELLK